jgi:hypothetical protein
MLPPNEKDRQWIAWTIIVGLIVISTITGVNFPIPQPPSSTDVSSQGMSQGVTDLSGLKVAAPTEVATATPAVVIDSNGVSNLLEIRDASTPVVSVNDGGNTDFAGTVQLGSGNRYPLEYASASRLVYFGLTSAFTGTTDILSTTHGCTTAVSAVLCAIDDPDDDAGDAFICIGTVDDGDVTINALDTADDASTEVDTTAYYVIVGN